MPLLTKPYVIEALLLLPVAVFALAKRRRKLDALYLIIANEHEQSSSDVQDLRALCRALETGAPLHWVDTTTSRTEFASRQLGQLTYTGTAACFALQGASSALRVLGESLPRVLEDYGQLPTLERLQAAPHLRDFIGQVAEARARQARARADVLRRRQRSALSFAVRAALGNPAMADYDAVADRLQEDCRRLKTELDASPR